MKSYREPWAAVLAAGEGSRLRSLTTDSRGNSIPKQFCSLNGGPSLLRLALRRAARVAPRSRITTIVAAQHEHLWRRELRSTSASNVFVQPLNRGTAIGSLLPLLHILARDPEAHLVLFPSDHFAADEPVLARAVRSALREIEIRPERLVLLGITPDEPDTGFGWIVPAGGGQSVAQPVERFFEKPPLAVATELMAQGGVWNSFILAASGRTLLAMFEEKLPGVAATLLGALACDPGGYPALDPLSRAYEGMGSFDFCRDVLEGLEDRLSVVPVPPCGWNDLGTPDRVVQCVERMPSTHLRVSQARATRPNLAQASLALLA